MKMTDGWTDKGNKNIPKLSLESVGIKMVEKIINLFMVTFSFFFLKKGVFKAAAC